MNYGDFDHDLSSFLSSSDDFEYANEMSTKNFSTQMTDQQNTINNSTLSNNQIAQSKKESVESSTDEFSNSTSNQCKIYIPLSTSLNAESRRNSLSIENRRGSLTNLPVLNANAECIVLNSRHPVFAIDWSRFRSQSMPIASTGVLLRVELSKTTQAVYRDRRGTAPVSLTTLIPINDLCECTQRTVTPQGIQTERWSFKQWRDVKEKVSECLKRDLPYTLQKRNINVLQFELIDSTDGQKLSSTELLYRSTQQQQHQTASSPSTTPPLVNPQVHHVKLEATGRKRSFTDMTIDEKPNTQPQQTHVPPQPTQQPQMPQQPQQQQTSPQCCSQPQMPQQQQQQIQMPMYQYVPSYYTFAMPQQQQQPQTPQQQFSEVQHQFQFLSTNPNQHTTTFIAQPQQQSQPQTPTTPTQMSHPATVMQTSSASGSSFLNQQNSSMDYTSTNALSRSFSSANEEEEIGQICDRISQLDPDKLKKYATVLREKFVVLLQHVAHQQQ